MVVTFLRGQPLALLLLVAALGYLLGQVRLAGTRLGVTAVLFVGLGLGALDPALQLPPVLDSLGLLVFVYTVGLTAAPAFLAAWRRSGLRDTLLILGVMLLVAGLALAARPLLGLSAGGAAGVFAGSLTNLPALAAGLDRLQAAGADAATLAEPVVACSVCYPMGVVGMLVALQLAARWWRIDFAAEARALRDLAAAGPLTNVTLRATKVPADGATLGTLRQGRGWHVAFGRARHQGHLELAEDALVLIPGDLVSVIGPAEEVAQVVAELGEAVDECLEADNRVFDRHRLFVSNPAVVGRTLAELALPQRFGALVTRIRRGDTELPGLPAAVLEPGDQVRVLVHRDRSEALKRELGDSYRAVTEVDFLTVSVGLLAGVLLGLVPVPLPGGLTVKLGLAGGPLIVALVLGLVHRTGPIVWSPPFAVHQTLRQCGAVLFLAGVGTRGGYAFATVVTSTEGLILLAAGTVLTLTAAAALLWIGHRRLGIPLSLLAGLVAGFQTQPAVLSFALEQTGNDLPNVGYAAAYPVATISKIILAQALLAG